MSQCSKVDKFYRNSQERARDHLDKLIDPKLIVGGLQGFGGLLPGYQVTEEQEPILGQPFLSLGH